MFSRAAGQTQSQDLQHTASVALALTMKGQQLQAHMVSAKTQFACCLHSCAGCNIVK